MESLANRWLQDEEGSVDPVVVIERAKTVKHLPGQHSQSSHGKGGGGTSGAVYDAESKTWSLANGDPLPDHLPKRIPPAWKDVQVSLDPDASLLVKGKDAKGRIQSVYSAAHSAKQAAKKFAKVNELRAKSDQIAKEIKADIAKGGKDTEAASALLLIQHTGIRPGSAGDTKADKQAYGATTLEGRHVHATGNKVRLKFTGKKGVNLDIPVEDRDLKSMLKSRKEAAGPTGKIFDTSDSALRQYAKSKDGGGFNPKDFRTAKGTSLALAEVKKAPIPKSQTAYKKAVREVAKKVSSALGNTPAVALSAYIDPTVFSSWRPAA